MKPLLTLLPLLIVILWVNCCHSEEFRTEFPQCKLGIYSDDTYTENAVEFVPYQKIYSKVFCEALKPGDYTLSLNWIDSKGGIQRQGSQSFKVTSVQDYVMFSWLKLHPKGTLLQFFSGDDFEPEQYGEWKVLSFINGMRIGEDRFTITR